MKSLVTFLVLFVFSSAVYAQPIYLECVGQTEVTKNTIGGAVGTIEPNLFSLTIDKENNNITYENLVIPLNFNVVHPRFKPTEILFEARAIYSLSMFDVLFRYQITIDRTDLSYETIELQERSDESWMNKQFEGSGQCSIVEVKETQI
jgi:hypothetical protein